MKPLSTRAAICVICGFIAFATKAVFAQSGEAHPPTEAARMTGPSKALQSAVAGGEPTVVFKLTPMYTYPGGTYNTAGCYDNSNISGNALTILSGPCRTYWNVFIEDWDPDYDSANGPQSGVGIKFWQARPLVSGYSSGSGAPLTPAEQPCSTSGECLAVFGEGGSVCGYSISGCNYWWMNRSALRTDRFRSEMYPPECEPALWDLPIVPPLYPLFNLSTPPDQPAQGIYCAMRDPHSRVYGGTMVLDVPIDAAGTYTIPLVEDETLAADQNTMILPLAALVPGVLVVQSGACCQRFSSYSAECTDAVTSLDCDCPSCTYHEDMTCVDLDCSTQLGACCDHGTENSMVAECSETTDLECVCEKCEWTVGAACEEIVCDPNFTPIPTVSEWGLLILTLLFAAGGKLLFARRAAEL